MTFILFTTYESLVTTLPRPVPSFSLSRTYRVRDPGFFSRTESEVTGRDVWVSLEKDFEVLPGSRGPIHV